MVGKVLKCQSGANLRLSPSLRPRSFHKFDEFLAHLQIFPTLVNIHKFMMNSKNVHASAFKRKQGIQAKTTKRVAHRDSQASVNLLFHIKCFHFLEFSAGLKKKKAFKAGYNATNTFVSIKSVYSISKVYPSLSSDPFPAFVASRHSLRERWPFPLTTATESSFWAAGSTQTHTLWWLIEILQGPDRLQ